MGELYL